MSRDNSLDYEIKDLLCPFTDWGADIICMQLADMDAQKSDWYLNNWELSKIYKSLALKLAINYRPKGK